MHDARLAIIAHFRIKAANIYLLAPDHHPGIETGSNQHDGCKDRRPFGKSHAAKIRIVPLNGSRCINPAASRKQATELPFPESKCCSSETMRLAGACALALLRHHPAQSVAKKKPPVGGLC